MLISHLLPGYYCNCCYCLDSGLPSTGATPGASGGTAGSAALNMSASSMGGGGGGGGNNALISGLTGAGAMQQPAASKVCTTRR